MQREYDFSGEEIDECSGKAQLTSRHVQAGALTQRNPNRDNLKMEKQSRMQELKRKVDEQVMQECTFQPKTNRNKSKRNLQEFLECQQKHLEKVSRNTTCLQQKVEEDALRDATFSPRINKRKQRNSGVAHKRLYLRKVPTPDNSIEPQTHRPKICSRSALMQRSKPVQDLLYQDAQRRMSKQADCSQECKGRTSSTPNTNKHAAMRFLREFYAVFEKYKFIEDQEFTYNEFNIIMKELGYVKYSVEIKNSLAIEEKNVINAAYKYLLVHKLSAYNLCAFLLAVGGIFEIDLIGDQTTGNLFIREEEGRRIQNQFDMLYRNKLTSETPKEIEEQSSTFRKALSPETLNLAEKYREKMLNRANGIFQRNDVEMVDKGVSHSDLMMIHSKGRNLDLDRQRQDKLTAIDPECTFKPAKYISPDKAFLPLESHLSSKKFIKRNNDDKKAIERVNTGRETSRRGEQKENLKSCKEIKDVDKTVLRMQEARDQKNKKQKFLARGQPLQNKRQKDILPRRSSHHSHQTAEFAPLASGSSVPFLVVDINLDGEMSHMYFYPGDELRIEDIVKQFCDQHEIEAESKEHLRSMVERQICEAMK